MSRKHKQKNDFFYRRNNEGNKREKAAMDMSKLRIRAGMAGVSALLILSPLVISAAGSIAHPAAQDTTGLFESEQTGSSYWFPGDEGGTGNTAAGTGSTLAAVPQNTGVFPADDEGEGTDSNDASTGHPAAEDDGVLETGGTSQEEEPEERMDDSNTSRTSQSMTNEEDGAESPGVDDKKTDSEMKAEESSGDSHTSATESNTSDTGEDRDQNKAAADNNDTDNTKGADAGKEDPNEGTESADASDDESEDHEDGDGEAASTGVTESESAEESEDQSSEQDEKDDNRAGFGSYGSNDFSGAVTPEIVRIPADEWAAYNESITSFLEREKEFLETGTTVFFDLNGAEYSTAIRNDSFQEEKMENGTTIVIETASLKDGTGVYENVVEYIIRNAGNTSDGEKVDLILTLDEARIELPEGSMEEASGKIAVSSFSDDHIFRAEARSIAAGTQENDADGENQTEAVAVRVSEKWSARIIRHEGDDVAEPRTFLFISNLDEVFGDPASETCDRERVAMLSGFSGKAFCCEDAAVLVSASGYLEGNGQPDSVILPINSADIQFTWGGTNCSTDIFTDFSMIKSGKPSEKKTSDKDDSTNPESSADESADTENAADADTRESMAESDASRAAILISYEEEPEKSAGMSAGDTVEVSMKVKNSGSELLKDVEVSEILDDDAELTVAWDSSSDPDTEENVLSEGETVPVTVTYTVTQDDIDTGKLVRKTEASAETDDRDEVEDEQTSEVILKGTASIDFSKKAAVQQISDARAGAAIQYFFTVTNSGNLTLRDIEVIDQMEGLSRIEYNWEESTDSRTGEGYLSPGERVTAYATYEITSDDIRNGKIVNKAFARGKTMQGKIIESNEPEAPTSISQEGKEGKRSGSPETGDETDLILYLLPGLVSFAVLVTSFVLGEIQRKKIAFDDEEIN